ncbi:cytochrome P450, partial [Cynara cardunculus var. scolymus]
MEAFYLFMPLIFLAIFIIWNYILHKLQNHPPNPWFPPLPIIGHLYLLKPPFHKSLAKHGPIQLLQFGSRPVLHVSSPSLAEECLTTNDVIFANRPRLLAGKYLGYNYTSLVFAPYGDHWRNLRRVSAIEILSSHRLSELEPMRTKEVLLTIRKLYRSSLKQAAEVQVKAMLVDLTLNTMMRMVSGKRYHYGSDNVLTVEEKEKADRFQELVAEIFEVMGATNIGDYMPVMRWLGVSKLEKQLIRLQARRDLFMQELVEELKEGLKNSGGTQTSISTMEWAMSLLLNNPSVLKKAQAEIDEYVGQDRLLQESDIANLPYLGCIIKETMRMFPAGPLLPHESTKDCKVGGYHIPSGTMLLVNVWGIQNDPTIWGDPKTFRPERFESLEGYRDGFKFMPFGSGRRSCPGEGMALRTVALGLGSLIQCFEWERTSESHVDLSEGSGVGMPKAINLVA